MDKENPKFTGWWHGAYFKDGMSLGVCMAKEHWINGKHDNAKHEGKASEIRRIAEAEDQVVVYLRGDAGVDHVAKPDEITSVQLASSPPLDKQKIVE